MRRISVVGQAVAFVVVLAAPVWVLAAQVQPAAAGHEANMQAIHPNVPAGQAQSSKQESSQNRTSWEERSMNRAPQFTDDVRLRVETYTGNSYPQ